MLTLVLAGEGANLAERLGVQGSYGGISIFGFTADTVLDLAKLIDGRPSRPLRAVSNSDDMQIRLEGDHLKNGNLNAWTGDVPNDWTEANSGTGNVALESTIVVSGNAAALVAGTGYALAAQTWEVRSGEPLKVVASLRGNGASAASKIRIKNFTTGKYLQSNGTWGATANPCITGTTTASYVQATLSFTVESFAICQAHKVKLQMEFYNDATSTTTYVDDIFVFAGVNSCSVHGHTIPAGATVQLISADTSAFSSPTIEATLSVVTRRSFYMYLPSTILKKNWALKIANTVTAAGAAWPKLQLGEYVIGNALALSHCPNDGIELREFEADISTETPAGEVHAEPLSEVARRVVLLPYEFYSHAEFEEMRDEVFAASRGRVRPMVIVRDSTRPDVIHGRIDRSWRAVLPFSEHYQDGDVIVAESPFPSSSL